MNTLVLWFHKLGSPPTFYRFARIVAPWLLLVSVLLMAVGLWWGLFIAPADYQQKDSFRIIYVHVPSAWMSLFAYLVMAINGAIALVWRIKLSELLAMACAPVGAMFTLVTLITGSLWGKPMWGTYWAWDARLTSELVLLFLYLGVMGLYQAFEDRRAAARAAAFLAIIGLVNIPIVHFSVKWWNTLHQGSTVRMFGESAIDPSMIWPLLIMALGTHLYFGASLLSRTQTLLLRQEGSKDWVRALLPARKGDTA